MPKKKLSPFQKKLEKINDDFQWLLDMKTWKDSLNYYFKAEKNEQNNYKCILSTRTTNTEPNFKELNRVDNYTYKFENTNNEALKFYGENNEYKSGFIIKSNKTQIILKKLKMCGMEVTNIIDYDKPAYADDITFTVQVKDNSDTTIFNKYFGSTVGASMKYTQYVLAESNLKM